MSAHADPQGPVQGRYAIVPDLMLYYLTSPSQPVSLNGNPPAVNPTQQICINNKRAYFELNPGDVTITCKGAVWMLHSQVLTANWRGFEDFVRDKREDDGTVSLNDEDPAVLDIFLDHIYTRDLNIHLLSNIRPHRIQGLAALAVMVVTHGQQQLYSQIQVLLGQISRMLRTAMAPRDYMLLLARDTLLATVTLHQHIAGYKELCSLQDTIFFILRDTRQLSIMSPHFVVALEEHIFECCGLTKMLIKYLAGGTVDGTEQ